AEASNTPLDRVTAAFLHVRSGRVILSTHAKPKPAYSTAHSIVARATQRGHRFHWALQSAFIVR
ncbi:hypothetical protein, partial [Streptomyces sp. NPDC041003]|uniref:hypothetical protein n=1 Tax=Streptomyces sp. NPDC041003 TaxID=3155730 RepID=UPI00340F6EF8